VLAQHLVVAAPGDRAGGVVTARRSGEVLARRLGMLDPVADMAAAEIADHRPDLLELMQIVDDDRQHIHQLLALLDHVDREQCPKDRVGREYPGIEHRRRRVGIACDFHKARADQFTLFLVKSRSPPRPRQIAGVIAAATATIPKSGIPRHVCDTEARIPLLSGTCDPAAGWTWGKMQ
jgi:hypothetical protein